MKHKQIVAFSDRIRKGSKVLIPTGDIQFLQDESTKTTKKFAIRSPLTGEWHAFDMPIEHIQANCYTKEVNEFMDYYTEVTYLLTMARDTQPMKRDLTALDEDECRLFGVRPPFKRWTHA